MKGINPIATQIANSPAAKLAAKLASSPAAKMMNSQMAKVAPQIITPEIAKAATRLSRIAQPYAEALQKLSHIEWIGKIPKHWGMCRIKNWASFINGFAFKSNELTTDKLVPVIRISDIQNGNLDYTSCLTFDYSNRLQAYLIKHNDIIIAMSGATTGKTALVKSDAMAYINQRVGIIRNAEKYIYYCLNTDMFSEYVNLLSAGSAQPNISMGQILNFSIPYIPKEKQQAIADYLDGECARIDGIVTTQRQIIERLKEYKKSVITEAVTRGLNPDAPMKDSGIDWIGKIPEHWEVRRIKTLGEYRNGLTYNPENMVDESNGTLVLRSSNIQNGKIVLDDNVFVNTIIPEQLLVHKGDIIICSRNGSRELVGKNALIKEDIMASFGAFMMIFRTNYPEYISYILNSAIFSYYLSTFFTATINQLTGSNFGNMQIVFCPDLNEQQEIIDYLDKECARIDTIIEKRERMIELMTEYKKSLIYECVTGKKEIVDVVE